VLSTVLAILPALTGLLCWPNLLDRASSVFPSVASVAVAYIHDLNDSVGKSCLSCNVSEENMQALVELTKSTGGRLLFDLNLQLRYGQQWDPSNAMELLQFFDSHGYGDNIDFELGNGARLKSM
jgi:hypothetical protein